MNRVYRLIALIPGIVFISHFGLSFADEIIIMGNYDKPPKIYLENGEAKGVLIDIMKYVDKNLPQTFTYQLFPWKRAYRNAENGEGGIVGLSMNSERLKKIDYSNVMFFDKLVLVVLKGNEFPFNSMQDLQGKIVGVLRGSSYGDEFEEAKNSIFTSDTDDSGQQRLLKLLSKRIDVALMGPGKGGVDSIIIKNQKLLERKDEFVILSVPFKRDPNYLGFVKTMKMQGFLQQFNKVLKKGFQSGDIQKILDNYSNFSIE